MSLLDCRAPYRFLLALSGSHRPSDAAIVSKPRSGGIRGIQLAVITTVLLVLTASQRLPAQPQTQSAPPGQPAPKAGTDPLANVDPMSLLPTPKTPQSQRVPIFYPPVPPPLGTPVAYAVTPPGRLAAPPELSMFVNDFFYPALSTRLFASTLYLKQRGQLGDYYATKVALQKALRAELNRLRGAEPAVRLGALEAFARMQAPKIAELEKTAERLRRTLTTVNYSWTVLREWHLGDGEKRGFSPGEIAKVMRGYAFYQNGLLPRQRLLLQEINLELLAAVDDPAKARAPQPYVFFSPEMARVRLPDDLPPQVAAKLSEYQAKRSQLKKELYDTVWEYDGGNIDFWRNPLRRLAKKQLPAFAELDTIAEEIRRGLAGMPAATPTVDEQSPLPPVLVERIRALLRARADAVRRASTRADAVVDRTYEVRVRIAYRFDEEGMKFVVAPGIGRNGPLTKEEDKFYDKVRKDLGVVADEYGRRLVELVNEEDAIRRDAGEALGTTRSNTIESAFVSVYRLSVQAESEEGYGDYRAAVFEPGLSPEQRKLLFDAGVERLELPLPRGEMQITSRLKTW